MRGQAARIDGLVGHARQVGYVAHRPIVDAPVGQAGVPALLRATTSAASLGESPNSRSTPSAW